MTEPVQRHCNRCGAPIVWAINGRGKCVPIDWHNTANGRYSLDLNAPRVRARFLPAPAARNEHERGGAVHNNHLTTCIKRGHKR